MIIFAEKIQQQSHAQYKVLISFRSLLIKWEIV